LEPTVIETVPSYYTPTNQQSAHLPAILNFNKITVF
jgi:hypothetical protein